LFTAEQKIVAYSAGHVSNAKVNEVADRLAAILTQP
jgi:hypothetical protein